MYKLRNSEDYDEKFIVSRNCIPLRNYSVYCTICTYIM